MDWLKELNSKRVFTYKNTKDPEDMIFGTESDLRGISGNPSLVADPGTSFEMDGEIFVYAGFEPVEMGLMTKITFEKNGRKAVRTKFGDGKSAVRSATKEAYWKGKGTESVLTKGCREASDKAKQEMIGQRAASMKRELQLHAHQIKQRGKKK